MSNECKSEWENSNRRKIRIPFSDSLAAESRETETLDALWEWDILLQKRHKAATSIIVIYFPENLLKIVKNAFSLGPSFHKYGGICIIYIFYLALYFHNPNKILYFNKIAMRSYMIVRFNINCPSLMLQRSD